jgi:AbrB family looped-hinge helix DNA binding protein
MRKEYEMELAKVTSKGQITIPITLRNKLNLNEGDKVVFLEENGRVYLENSAKVAFAMAEQAFAGAAEEAGFKTEEDMQKYMKDLRKELRGL